MAEKCPARLDDFCTKYSVSIFSVSLPCIFCRFICDLQDIAAFHIKKLSIVWRGGKPYICCRKCANLSAKFEYEQYCVCIVKAISIECLLQKSLYDITVRCLCCYKLLDTAEKVDCCASDEYFALVRGSWRAPCRDCIRKQ